MQFFDTHAHIGLIYDDPIEQLRVIHQAKQAGVTRIISINNSLHDFERVYPALKVVSGVYHAVGVAPSEVVNPGTDYAEKIEKYLTYPNVVAVGEMGLDYYKQFGNKRSQIELFITQLEIAQKHNLPAIIHNRDAGKDVYDVLRERIPDSGAIFHCYSENAAYAKKCLDMNVYFSFAGNLTYRNAHNLHETVLSRHILLLPQNFLRICWNCRLRKLPHSFGKTAAKHLNCRKNNALSSRKNRKART